MKIIFVVILSFGGKHVVKSGILLLNFLKCGKEC